MSNNRKLWPSPAKINRFLHITSQREDGYHTLQTVFQFLAFGDELSIKPMSEKRVVVENPALNEAIENDLVYRAAVLLQKETCCDKGARIRVQKNIPMGGGLGGGSSNAATTLVALNELWQTGLDVEQLKQLGVSLGADVPIFVQGVGSWAEGVGEQLTPMILDEPYLLLVHPGVHVDTGKVFKHPELPRSTPLHSKDEWHAGFGHNDCEALVRKLYPEVEKAFQMLAAYPQARMTGTGACIYVPFTAEQAARDALKALPKNCWAIVTKGLNRSPLVANIRASQS